MAGGLPANRTVNGFMVDPEEPRIMFVGMRDGLFKSEDAGRTWKATGEDLKNLAAVTVNPRKTSQVYAATMDGVIFRSVDGGIKWERRSGK